MKINEQVTRITQKLEQQMADTIGRCVNRFSVRTRKIGLIIFGLITGTICLLLIRGLIGISPIQVDKLTIPHTLYSPDSDTVDRKKSETRDSLNKVYRGIE